MICCTMSKLSPICNKTTLGPLRGFCGEVRRTGRYHAESLAAWSLQDPPGVNELDTLGSQFLEPSHLGVNVISLDIEMHAARMAHRLHFDVQAMLQIFQLLVGLLPRGQVANRHPERAAPKIRRSG